MNVLEHENIDSSEENIEDDIDHTFYASEDEDDDLVCEDGNDDALGMLDQHAVT